MKDETLLAHDEEDRAPHQGAVVPPIYQNSLFTFESWEAIDEAFDDRVNNPIYSRGTNPTVRMVERKIASLARGERAQLFGSGMAAIAAAILHCVSAGDHVITIKNVYGPANNLLNRYLRDKLNLEVTFVSGERIEDFEEAVRPNTKLIYLESPSSAVFSLQDIRAVTALAGERKIKTMIDNTWATPIFQNPLEMGIDIEIHSVSKYLAGHSDIVAGVLIGSDELVRDIAVKEGELLGARIAPFEAWLLLRSLRTLPIRMERHQKSALEIALFLETHPKVLRVFYPGLASHPQYELGKTQLSGYSGLLSFELASEDLDRIKAFFNSLKYFLIGVSWGGHESLIYAPAISYLKELPEDQFEALGIGLGNMRISVGQEHCSDLTADLEQALKHI